MTKEKIAELRELCDRADLAPWVIEHVTDQVASWSLDWRIDGCGGSVAYCFDRADAEFIAASRKVVWDLLDEVERLHQRNETLRHRAVIAERKLREGACSSV